MPTTRIPLSGTTAGSVLAQVIVDARHLAGWSQAELAGRAGTSKGTLWRLETGHAQVLDFVVVEAVIKALGFRATLELDGRHLLDRERQLDAVHAWLNGHIARRMRRAGWKVATEVLIDAGGPRGWIDLLAFREADGTLIVEETKTDLPDIGGLQRSLEFYAREARRVAEGFGWKVRRVVVLCVVLDSADVAARITGARELLAVAFPGDVAVLGRLVAEAGAPAPTGWCLAAVDPASRDRSWLRGTALTRRRRAPAYQGYAAAASVLRARSGEAARSGEGSTRGARSAAAPGARSAPAPIPLGARSSPRSAPRVGRARQYGPREAGRYRTMGAPGPAFSIPRPMGTGPPRCHDGCGPPALLVLAWSSVTCDKQQRAQRPTTCPAEPSGASSGSWPS